MTVLLSLGHGFSSRALARLLTPLGWDVIGTTRSEEKAAEIRAEGNTALLWSQEDAIREALGRATHLLTSVAPKPEGDPALDIFGAEIAAKAKDLHWTGYLSTTGVYGDHQGGWVDEQTPLSPSTKRGQLRVMAETAWQDIPDLHPHVFRLAGIYGPGRGPFAKVRKGTARRIIKPNQVFSRIHVDDIAQVLLASINAPNPGAVYNLCDDDPAPPQDVLSYAAELLGLPLPPEEDFETADMTPMARSFYAESKRVRNDLIKSELGIKLLYPTYRAALQAMLKAETA